MAEKYNDLEEDHPRVCGEKTSKTEENQRLRKCRSALFIQFLKERKCRMAIV